MRPGPLPHALLDLTYLRLAGKESCNASFRTQRLRTADHRLFNQAALQASPPEYGELQALNESHQQARRGRRVSPLALRANGNIAQAVELQRRVHALQEQVVDEQSLFDKPFFSEDELLGLYRDLLAIPSQVPQTQAEPASETESANLAADNLQRQVDHKTLNLIQTRLANFGDDLDEVTAQPSIGAKSTQEVKTLYTALISHLDEIVSRVDAIQSLFRSKESKDLGVSGGEANSQDVITSVPVSLLAKGEWESLFRVCIANDDAAAAGKSLELMKRSGFDVNEEFVNQVMRLYAELGSAEPLETFMAKVLITTPNELQRDLHVKCHLKAMRPKSLPESALRTLHNYEAQNCPAPMKSYTRTVSQLFSLNSSVAYAQAWDLFSHMRYVSHSTPDVMLYGIMIRACACNLASQAEPERALDLWTEMTVDNKIEPNVQAYNAIILACAKSGRKAFVAEAFRLAKEMLDSGRDAWGRTRFGGYNLKMVNALLEGAKRIGDLARARWILAELVRGVGAGELESEGGNKLRVTEEVMMHVFHAYAGFTPPFKRGATLLEETQDGDAENLSTSRRHSESKPEGVEQSGLPVTEEEPSFTFLAPQSREEVLAEASSLFQRILRDRGSGSDRSNLSTAQNEEGGRHFAGVEITTRLVNCYLGIFYKHAPLSVSKELFKRIFTEAEVQPSSRSYVEALERCATFRREGDRSVAREFAEETFRKWKEWEDKESWAKGDPEYGKRKGTRLVERAYVAMIRTYALMGDLVTSVGLVKAFVQRYPPASINASKSRSTSTPTTHVPKLPLQSTRTVLVGTRPLVRLTSAVEVPDDHVPPLLTFEDLELLHHRLVAAGKVDEVGYLKYICLQYRGALRNRRASAFKEKC